MNGLSELLGSRHKELERYNAKQNLTAPVAAAAEWRYAGRFRLESRGTGKSRALAVGPSGAAA
jgi:hypothetical protein